MEQPNQCITRKNIPDDAYYSASPSTRRYFDYLLGIADLIQLPAFDSLHSVRYEVIPGQWPKNADFGKGWQVISKLTPDRELRLYMKSHVASPDHPFYHGIFSVPTQIYEYFIDVQNGGFGGVYLSYPKEQENNLDASAKGLKTLSDNCIQCLTDASKRQIKNKQTQNVCLQKFGYSHLGDSEKKLFGRLNDAKVGEEEIVPIINMIRRITSLYNGPRNR